MKHSVRLLETKSLGCKKKCLCLLCQALCTKPDTLSARHVYWRCCVFSLSLLFLTSSTTRVGFGLESDHSDYKSREFKGSMFSSSRDRDIYKTSSDFTSTWPYKYHLRSSNHTVSVWRQSGQVLTSTTICWCQSVVTCCIKFETFFLVHMHVVPPTYTPITAHTSSFCSAVVCVGGVGGGDCFTFVYVSVFHCIDSHAHRWYISHLTVTVVFLFCEKSLLMCMEAVCYNPFYARNKYLGLVMGHHMRILYYVHFVVIFKLGAGQRSVWGISWLYCTPFCCCFFFFLFSVGFIFGWTLQFLSYFWLCRWSVNSFSVLFNMDLYPMSVGEMWTVSVYCLTCVCIPCL